MQAVNTFPWFKELLADHQGPCVSIYLPTPRNLPMGNEAVLQYRELVEKAEAELSGMYDVERVRAMKDRLVEAGREDNFIEGSNREGLAFFVSEDISRVIEIRRPIEVFVGVADSFHVKPLIRALQASQRYHVLCVGLRTVRLFEGDEGEIHGVKLKENIPRGADDDLINQSAGTSPNLAQLGQPSAPTGSAPIERYFRMLDQAIWESYSRDMRLPLIICADVQHLSTFMSITKNDYVLKDHGIAHNAEAATREFLREEAWKILGPQFKQQIDLLKDAYHAAKARRLGSDELTQVAEAAANGRVGTLLVDSDVKIPGILHRYTGLLEEAPMENARADDLLDDLAEMVLRMDGQVYVVPHAEMPTEAGLAAVYRY